MIQPSNAEQFGLPADRFATNQLRLAADWVTALVRQSPVPLARPREPEEGIVGTCRHFALLACALLRHHGVPARARCGFATYCQQGRAVDHWVVEHWEPDTARWVRVDPEILGGSVLDRAGDLMPGDFLTGGEAWLAHRAGEVDPMTFGVAGTDNWGPAEIAGNVVRDLAALNKVEMLPWDEWGRMTEAYAGHTGADYDALLDEVARIVVADDMTAMAAVYALDDFVVPQSLRS